MILTSIITYNPDIELLNKNIQAIVFQVDKVIIIDNGSENQQKLVELLSHHTNVEYVQNGNNEGVAYALNQALEYAEINRYQWLLTLDQDSICSETIIEKYMEIITNNKDNNILLLCPQIKDVNSTIEQLQSERVEEVDVAITSGSLLNVEQSIKIGGFLSRLFIDYVDFEFCLRGQEHALKILRVNSVTLQHTLGRIEEKKVFGYRFVVTNHTPFRRYYLFRNKIFLYKKYYRKNSRWVYKNILSTIKTFFIILVFEENKKENTKFIFKGIWKGILLK